MPGLRLITAPAMEPINLIEARLHLKLDATGSPAAHPDDSIVTSLITAIRQHLDGRDGRLNRCLISQDWELVLDEFPSNEIRIPLPPLQQIFSVKYDDVNGAEQIFPSSDYVVDTVSQPGWILPKTGKSWPATMDTINAVRIRFKAGYGDAAANVPTPIRQAMLLMIGHLYENRELVTIGHIAPELPFTAEALLSAYEVITIT